MSHTYKKVSRFAFVGRRWLSLVAGGESPPPSTQQQNKTQKPKDTYAPSTEKSKILFVCRCISQNNIYYLWVLCRWGFSFLLLKKCIPPQHKTNKARPHRTKQTLTQRLKKPKCKYLSTITIWNYYHFLHHQGIKKCNDWANPKQKQITPNFHHT